MIRLGTLILFKNNYCYQSYGWNMIRPLGRIENAVKYLDAYETDEISIIRPIRNEQDNYLESDIEILKSLKTSTPISFGGGIRNLNHLKLLEGLPFERYIFSSVLFDSSLDLLSNIQSKFGKQAIIGSLPFRYNDGKFEFFNSSKNKFVGRESLNKIAIEMCDEILFYDCNHEGEYEGFNNRVLEYLEFESAKSIFSGGVYEYFKENLKPLKPAAILFENKVLHKEDFINNIKNGRM